MAHSSSSWAHQRPGAALPPWFVYSDNASRAYAAISEAEVEDYRQLRATQAAEQMVRVFKRIWWLVPANIATHVLAGRVSLGAALAVVAPSAALYVWLLWQDRYWRRVMAETPLLASAVMQIVMLCAVSFGCAIVAPLANSDLMQHRIFLGASLPWLAYETYVGYIPLGFPSIFCGPVYFIAWILFHYLVNFINPSVLFYGFGGCVISIYTFEQADAYHWERYVMKTVLNTQKQQLEGIQTTLKGMLASLFDASCTCGSTGKLLSCTPQFRQLLAGSQNCEGWNFGVFASDASEQERVRNYIAQASAHAIDRAAVLHSSLQALPVQTQTPADDDARMAHVVRETTIYAIALPQGPDDVDGSQEGRLFIGLQTSGPAVQNAFQDELGQGKEFASGASHTDEQNASDALELKEMCDEVKPLALSAMETWSKHMKDDSIDARSDRDEDRSLAQWSISQSGSSLRYSSTAASSQGSSQKKRQVSVAGPRYFHKETQTDIPTGRPPLPSNDAEQALSRRTLRQVPKPKPRVCLGTSQRLLGHFQETPRSSLELGITFEIVHVNCRGVGCCKWHIALKNMARVVRDMQAGVCRTAWSPMNGWQCRRCLSLNEEGESDSDDSGSEANFERLEKECDICRHVGKPLSPIATSSNSDTTRA